MAERNASISKPPGTKFVCKEVSGVRSECPFGSQVLQDEGHVEWGGKQRFHVPSNLYCEFRFNRSTRPRRIVSWW